MFCHRSRPFKDAILLKMGGEVVGVVRNTKHADGKLQLEMEALQSIRIELTTFGESEFYVRQLRAKGAKDGAQDRN